MPPGMAPQPIADEARPEPSEFTDRSGAGELKARIEEYWRARGHDIQVVLIEAAFSSTLRASRFDVRSDLVNGLPRTRPARSS